VSEPYQVKNSFFDRSVISFRNHSDFSFPLSVMFEGFGVRIISGFLVYAS